MKCKKCEKELDALDVGAHRKFIDKFDTEYLCRDCLADHFGWTREAVDEYVRKFRENGCLLFP